MDADNSLATAYIDGKFAKEWTTTFTAGNVGGAAFNGFTNTIIYKDIQVGRIGMYMLYTVINPPFLIIPVPTISCKFQ